MSLEFTYDGSAFAVNVKPSTISIPQRAEMGDTGNGVVPIDDMAGTVEIVGHKAFLVEESTCSQPRLFTGWTVERDYARQGEGGLIVEASRVPEVNIVGPSAAAGFRIIWDTDGNRPEETWNDRLAWIVGSDYLGPLIGGDDTFFGSYTQTMDPADYRGSNAGSVLEDLCERTGGVLNWFLFWSPDTSNLELFIKREQYTIGQCTLSISNIESEVDGITVFKPDDVAKLAREPDQTYSEVIVEYGGQKVYRTLDTTATQFIQRGTTISRPYTKRESTAIIQADQWLRAHSYERDRITCIMRSVPASLVGLVQAGMGIDVKFSHFDVEGYADAPVTMRIVMCSPVPVSDIGDLWDISLELLGAAPTPTETVGMQFQVARLALYDGAHPGDECGRFSGTEGLLYFENTGDAPKAGYAPYASSGALEAVYEPVRLPGSCGSGYTKIRVLADGIVTVSLTAASIWVHWATITWRIDLNGVPVDSISHGLTDNGDSITAFTVTDVPVEPGDLISASVTMDPLPPPFWALDDLAGGGAHSYLTVTGTLSPVGTGGAIPSPTHTTDPTVDDDAAHGFGIGSIWVNTATGRAFVLVDDTAGAAEWLPVANLMLDELADVSVASPATGDTIIYDATTAMWNSAPGGFPDPTITAGDIIVRTTMVDAALTGTATANSTYSSYFPALAIDGNDATFHAHTSLPASWLAVDLGTVVEIGAFRLFQGGAYGMAYSYVIESSDDETTWTVRYTVPPTAPADSGVVLLPGLVHARYWRVRVLTGYGFTTWYQYTFSLFTSTIDRLPIGAEGDVLSVVGGDVAWAIGGGTIGDIDGGAANSVYGGVMTIIDAGGA